jgi:hypothetical protein
MALSQTKLVLQHLIEHGSITSYEAIKLFGATRLSAIIYVLRHDYGYNIASHFEKVTTRYGYKTQIAVYKLERERKKERDYEHQD